MNSPETQFAPPKMALDRDAFVHHESIDLLERARDKIMTDLQFQSNYEDGTWDENGNRIDYENADKTGEQ